MTTESTKPTSDSKSQQQKHANKKKSSSSRKRSSNPFSLLLQEIMKPGKKVKSQKQDASKEKKQQDSGPPLPPNPSFLHVMSLQENHHTRLTFIIGTLAMFSIPIISYFLSFIYIFPNLELNYRIAWSAVVAVVAVQVVAGCYIAYSLRVDAEERQRLSQQQGTASKKRQ